MGILFNHLNYVKMKKFKLLIPMMVFVMAIGMAFTPKSNGLSAGWINLNGVATPLNNHPCDNGTEEDCKVTFEDDPDGHVYTVYINEALITPVTSSKVDPYVMAEKPE